jgi:hypothetical protein
VTSVFGDRSGPRSKSTPSWPTLTIGPQKSQTWFTTVKQLRPGATLRSFFHADAGLQPDLFSEVTCRRVHEETVGANPQARDIERALAAAFTKEARP